MFAPDRTPNHAVSPSLTGQGQTTLPRRMLSCIACREAKVRCDGTSHLRSCERCARKRLHCVRNAAKRKPRAKTKSSQEGESASPTVYDYHYHASLAPQPQSNHWMARDRPDEDSYPTKATTESDRQLGFFGPSRGGSTSPDRHVSMGLPQLLNPVRLLAETSSKEAGVSPEGPTAVLRGFMRRSRDHFEPRREPESICGPLFNGILSDSAARDLFRFFMEHINPIATMLDPLIHTFEFVTPHGSLLTAVCLVSAWHRSGSPFDQLANRLEDHLLQRCRPSIVVDRYCTVEIVIAFALYVQFHPCAGDAANDYAWAMLGEAIKCATELDLHSATSSSSLAPLDELGHRHARIRERTWMNLWLIEQSLSHQTGRRSSLTVTGVLSDCADWHLSPHKVSGDAILIGQISLRRKVMESQEFLVRFSDSKTGVELCLRRIRWEVDEWMRIWSRAEPTSTRSKKVPLYAGHAKIVLCSTLLQKCPRTLHALDGPFFLLYESVISYLSCLLDPANVQIIRYGQRGLFMTASYICCIAFKLIRIAHLATWICVKTLRNLVQQVATAFKETANGNNALYNTPQSHSRFLFALLSSFEGGSTSIPHADRGDHVTEAPLRSGTQREEFHQTQEEGGNLSSMYFSTGEEGAVFMLDDASLQAGRDFVTWFDDFLFDSHLPA